MLKSRHGAVNWLSEIMIALMDADKLITYSFLEKEIKISRREISGIKQGHDMSLHYYVDAVACIQEVENFEFDEEALLKLLKKAIKTRSNVVLSLRRRTTGEDDDTEDEGEESAVVLRWNSKSIG